ncbi:Ig-like domain-containing protein [Wukongibacter sp. M2B1]|uniref:Ig-like domain-containing protein n=1 Tax=Wukongibacter sp. M2B1 TaxID=3088895 RepID=UPI003D799971
MKKGIRIVVSFIMIFSIVISNTNLMISSYAYSDLYDEVRDTIERTSEYIIDNDTYYSDWQIVGLANAEESIPSSYLKDSEKSIKKNDGYFRKVTDYERMAIGITAAGGDPRDIGGYNLIEKIYNFEDGNKEISFQGINGVIYALVALDSKRYDVPSEATYDRDWLIEYILDNQNGEGGWSLSGGDDESDIDITAMALIALAPYHDYSGVSEGVEGAVEFLSDIQREDNGGFDSWGAEDNCESVCQAIIGLCSNGIDPTSDTFTKSGYNLIDALLSFAQEDGSFLHTKDGEGNVGMSTEQAYQALLAYDKFVRMDEEYCDGENSIYYFGEAEPQDEKAPVIEVEGLEDDLTVYESELKFTVSVDDNEDDDIIPVVELNGREVDPIDDNEYEVELDKGKNAITIEAEDEAGNRAKEKYEIIFKFKEEEDFKEFEPKNDVKSDKVWQIKFNSTIKEGCVNTENVVILNEKAQQHPVDVEIIEDNTAIKVVPQEPYDYGKTYTLYVKTKNVSKEIKSEDDKKLKQGIKMNFTIED